VFSTKNNKDNSTKKDENGIIISNQGQKSQDMIETDVDDSSLNINIKKEVDMLKIVKTEEQGGELDI